MQGDRDLIAFPDIRIDVGSAYEFLLSLVTVHKSREMEGLHKYEYPSLYERTSSDLLALMNELTDGSNEMWANLLGIAYNLSPPRDVPALIEQVSQTDEKELLLILIGYYQRSLRRRVAPAFILNALSGERSKQREFLQMASQDNERSRRGLTRLLSLQAERVKQLLLEIMQRWYDEVFSELEPELLPILQRDAESKRVLKQNLSPERLIIQATNGVEYIPEPHIREILLVPTVVLRPYNKDSEHSNAMVICYPVADESMLNDPLAPPMRLVRLFKALADERRLRILKKLADGSYSLQELADDFGVAKTTIHHHCVILRAAGLIRISLGDRRYSLREEMLPGVSDLLEAYLKQGTS